MLGLDLGLIWTFISTFPLDHPISLLIIAFLAQKLGPISWFLLWVLRAVRDKMFDDTEAAGALWHLAALISGLWPNKSRGFILKYAPRHWRTVILEGQAPTFRLVAVPLDRVIDVQDLLMPGRTVNIQEDLGSHPPITDVPDRND